MHCKSAPAHCRTSKWKLFDTEHGGEAECDDGNLLDEAFFFKPVHSSTMRVLCYDWMSREENWRKGAIVQTALAYMWH